MQTLKEIFGNREVAAWIWVILISLFLIFKLKLYRDSKDLLRIFFSWSIQRTIFLMLIYIFCILYILHIANFWDKTMIKETIYWIGGVGSIMLMNSNKANEDSEYFKKKIIDSIKFIIIFEFIVNFYSFSLLLEFIIFPFVLLIGIMNETANEPENQIVKKFCGIILTIIGFAYLTYAVYQTICDFDNFFSISILKSFLLIPILTLLYLPFIYLMALYMRYESYFVQIGFRMDGKKDVLRYAKRKIFKFCFLNLRKLNDFTRKTKIYHFDTIEGINETINNYKHK